MEAITEILISYNSKASGMFLQECVRGPKIMDPRSRPDGELQDEMSLFTSHGREEVLSTIKSAQNMHLQE
jgi:hypothetical protein